MWFDTIDDVVRILLVGPATYTAVVVMLRLSGKRTLTQLNVFDFIITVALGSAVATILLNAEVSFAEGVVGLATLIALQYVVATLGRHNRTLRSLVKSEPTALVVRGEVRHEVLHKERLTVGELRQALRRSGVADVADVAAVVLETDGSLSILTDAHDGATSMADVEGWSGVDDARSDR
jgi:uncharacterized membrane protein YcaP (DUF421 family)